MNAPISSPRRSGRAAGQAPEVALPTVDALREPELSLGQKVALAYVCTIRCQKGLPHTLQPQVRAIALIG